MEAYTVTCQKFKYNFTHFKDTRVISVICYMVYSKDSLFNSLKISVIFPGALHIYCCFILYSFEILYILCIFRILSELPSLQVKKVYVLIAAMKLVFTAWFIFT